MPRLDGTGPRGLGSRTGRGCGPCCVYSPRCRAWTQKNEKEALDEEEKMLEKELKAVREEKEALKDQK
ncbi:MAG: DUF5320 domain-containing protein [Candidatus Pacebacteria bacterium]|nr:DUF5320 domain-containing protein [Candidatus Paceibacterota bacterium]